MSGINGVSLAKRLKGKTSDINLFFYAGYSEYVMEALKLNVSGYLLKPIVAQTA